MSTVPARQDVRFIANSVLAYSFTFNLDDNPIDLSAKDNVTVVLKNANTTIFSHSVTGGELTISGAGSNKISGTATSTVMDIAARSYELIIFFNDDPDKEIKVMFDVTIFDENSELQSTASDWTIELDSTSGTATAQASQVITSENITEIFPLGVRISLGIETAFTIGVKTDNDGSSNDDQFQLTGAVGNYDVEAYNMSYEKVQTYTELSGEQTITLPSSGKYILRIMPTGESPFNRIQFDFDGDYLKVIALYSWGDVEWSSMAGMFAGCENMLCFFKDTPDLSSVTTTAQMFFSVRDLNQSLKEWDTSNITDMSFMFASCINFNQDINAWDVSNVTTMASMFNGASKFNYDISAWDVRNVNNMSSMFRSTSFDQNIGDWDITSISTMQFMFFDAGLSTENYDSLLIGWESQAVPDDINFHAGSSKYTSGGAAEAARTALINDHNWSITDGGSV